MHELKWWTHELGSRAACSSSAEMQVEVASLFKERPNRSTFEILYPVVSLIGSARTCRGPWWLAAIKKHAHNPQ